MNIDPFNKALYPYMVGNDPVSDFKVMKSAAGYYIGRSYYDTEFGFDGPYSRESGYMTKAEAEMSLASNFPVRDCIENNALYESGELPHPHQTDDDEEHNLAQEEFYAWQQANLDEEEGEFDIPF